MKWFVMVVCVVVLAGNAWAGSYTKAQIKTANKIMQTTKQMANVFEEDGRLVIEFQEYLFPYDINKRLNFVRAIADADVILHGSARSIFYYNPGGKQIAKADTLNGVRLE